MKINLKKIKRLADEDSNNIIFSNITYSTPEQATKYSPFKKAFWFSFFWIFYFLQSISGNLK